MRYGIRNGFTIVELLIVIVVIAILAAITIVAFNGIQNRANDSAVQGDLKNIAKLFEVYKVDNGRYPAGTSQLSGLGIKVTKTAYAPGFSAVNNLLYCRNTNTGSASFALLGQSKSGALYVYRSETNGITERRGATAQDSWFDWGSSAGNCNHADVNVPIDDPGTGRDLLYNGGSWMNYVGG